MKLLQYNITTIYYSNYLIMNKKEQVWSKRKILHYCLLGDTVLAGFMALLNRKKFIREQNNNETVSLM